MSYQIFKNQIITFIVAGTVLMAVGCAPKVKSFTPVRGPESTDVSIEGQRFKSTPSGNTVKFGGVTATDVTVPSTSRIIAKVPAGAVTGEITVTTSKGTGHSDTNFVVTGLAAQAKWTFMVYIAADNNLEDAAITDFLEMASVGTSADVNIVVQMDRAPGYTNAYGDWRDTRRFLVQNGDTPATAPLQNLGEINMGDPNELQDFVEWAIINHPAEHYALSIWNHGGGWRIIQERALQRSRSMGDSAISIVKAVAWDDTDGHDPLYMKEVQMALEGAKQRIADRSGTSVKLDVVGFDACLMGMVEVAYALRNVANYMVGSEHVEPNNGWPYDTILADLVATPTFSPSDLAGLVVTKYYQSYTGASQITQASLDISAMGNVVSKINNFTSKANTEWANLKIARDNTREYHVAYVPDTYWGVDLLDFSNQVYNRVSSNELKTAALEMKTALNSMVTNELHTTDMNGSHGVAIYFPASLTIFNNDPDHTGYVQGNTTMPVDFVKNNRWDEWLQQFYSNTP